MTSPISGTLPATDAKAAKLEKACTQLQAVFMNELAKAMRETVPQDGALPESSGSEMFSSLFDEKVSDLAAGQLDHGITAALIRQLGGGR